MISCVWYLVKAYSKFLKADLILTVFRKVFMYRFPQRAFNIYNFLKNILSQVTFWVGIFFL